MTNFMHAGLLAEQEVPGPQIGPQVDLARNMVGIDIASLAEILAQNVALEGRVQALLETNNAEVEASRALRRRYDALQEDYEVLARQVREIDADRNNLEESCEGILDRLAAYERRHAELVALNQSLQAQLVQGTQLRPQPVRPLPTTNQFFYQIASFNGA